MNRKNCIITLIIACALGIFFFALPKIVIRCTRQNVVIVYKDLKMNEYCAYHYETQETLCGLQDAELIIQA